MSHSRAAVVGAQATAALTKACRQLVVLRNDKRYLCSQLAKQTARVEKKQKLQQKESLLELEMTPSGKRLTWNGTLALGIRRHLSHIAAADFGAVLLRDISGSTVLRAEVKTGAAVTASMRDFTNISLTALQDVGSGVVLSSPEIDLADISYDDKSWHLLFISIRADATNSSIWRREKLHVAEAELGLVHSSVKDFPSASHKFIKTRRCLWQP